MQISKTRTHKPTVQLQENITVCSRNHVIANTFSNIHGSSTARTNPLVNFRSARKKDHAQVHHKHFTKSNQVAAEQRYAHEYGDMSVKASQDLAKSTDKTLVPNPKDSFDQAMPKPNTFASAAEQQVKPQKPAQPNQAGQMKNKFEEALMNASKPKAEPSVPPVATTPVENNLVTSKSAGRMLAKEGMISNHRY